VKLLELIAVAFSLACVVLAARRHIGTWPAGIVAVIAYFVVFVDSKLYADATLQLIFLGQGLYGWMLWMRGRGEAALDAGIRVLSWKQRATVAALVITASLAIGTGLSRYTDASRPLIDSTVSVLSLAANWLLARRILENWILWLTADILYVGLFISKGLHASALLYTLFLALAFAGWRSWLRTMSDGERPTVGWAV
jgi:nicotinamide mononucleotide transporter